MIRSSTAFVGLEDSSVGLLLFGTHRARSNTEPSEFDIGNFPPLNIGNPNQNAIIMLLKNQRFTWFASKSATDLPVDQRLDAARSVV